MNVCHDYYTFLRERLPELARRRLPFYRRTRKSKHDTLRHVLRSTRLQPEDLVAEFGVYRATTLRMIARALPRHRLYGFDSFEGFPDDGRSDWQHDFSLGGKLPAVPANVELVQGYFEDSLPTFVEAHAGARIGLLHVDCDLYSSTCTLFQHCAPLLQSGCVIVFDELLHYPGFLDNEMKAFYEYLLESGRDFAWLATRGRVMMLDAFLQERSLGRLPATMKEWRAQGYEQEVALRLV